MLLDCVGREIFLGKSLLTMLRLLTSRRRRLRPLCRASGGGQNSQNTHETPPRSIINMLNPHLDYPHKWGAILAPLLVCILWLPALASGQIESLSSSASTTEHHHHHHSHHQEILVQPNSQVRIECKLPQTTPSKSISYLWNFDRTVGVGSAKQNVLCFESKCVDEPTFGYQLEMDKESGAYDLIFSNVTYELNDGLYYCKYKDTNPESKQILNREFRLTVLIPAQPPTISPATLAPAREGQEYHLNCQSHGGNPEPNITWYRNEQPIVSLLGLRVEQLRVNETTTSTLSWIPTMDDHQAVYKCVVWNKAMSPLQSYERELRLQVEYAPRISVGPSNPLKVLLGAPLTLPCQVDANPPVKGIRWFKDGHLIGNQYNHTIQEAKISDTSLYSCQADNGIPPLVPQLVGANGGQSAVASSNFFSFLSGLGGNNGVNQQDQLSRSVVETQLQVQVLYPPRVQVRPSKFTTSNEGEYFALNCSADAWPPAHEFLWTRQDDPTFKRQASGQSGSTLEFHSISASDMGNYTCTAFNRMEPSNMQQQAIERQSSASALVQVRHKPGVAEITVGQAGETELGAKTLVQCRAKPPGYPEPQYRFWKYSMTSSGKREKFHLRKDESSVGPVYTIYSAKSNDEAKYGCVALNELGASNDAEAELIVNEPPTIIHDASARRDEDARYPGEAPYSITVRASGKPEPKVSWYHRSPVDGKRVELSWPEMQSKFKIDTIVSKSEVNHARPKFNVVSTLTFRNPLDIDDRGLYTVEFNNGLSQTAVEGIQLHIHHAPVPALKNHPILAGQHAAMTTPTASGSRPSVRVKAGFEMNETVNLTCRVSAYPKPRMEWFTNIAPELPSRLDSNPRYKITQTNPSDDIWESTLSFVLAQDSDFSDYLCSSANLDERSEKLTDSISIVVTLQQKSAPDAPIQLEAVDATQDSITLQWIPGFDGGYALNQYTVQYAPDDGSGMTLNKRYPNADSSYTVGNGNNNLEDLPQANSLTTSGYPKFYECLSMNPCTINPLAPRQAYVFRIRAKNEHGQSEYSEELRASTRANISQIPKIMDASLDAIRNVLHFRIEPGSDYLLNNLNARIEYRSATTPQLPTDSSSRLGQPTNSILDQVPTTGQDQQQPLEWKPLTSVHTRQEKVEAMLAIQSDMDQLRITLCSRSNESLCGPEFVVGIKSAASSFLQEQRGLSLTIMMSTITLIIVLTAFATTVHTCCLSRRNKKADSIERVEGSIDNKPINGSTNTATGGNKSAHGSTTSTNSTSANGTGSNGLQSIDSINGALNGGSSSDHSSDHSRQAKLDTMIPPNYNHYADRASIIMEQQQQQQQQMMHQQGLMGADKLSSPFGLPNSALLSVAGQQQPQPSPMMNGSINHFAYGGQMDPHQSYDQQHASMMDANMMLGSGLEQHPADGQQQMWPLANQMDDYNNYNALAGHYTSQQQQVHDQMIDPTYVTTGSVMMSQHSAAYDNSANSGQFQAYMSPYQQQPSSHESAQQQRVQFQQGMAVAQQQIYGTLTRKNYKGGSTSGAASDMLQNNSTNQQLMEQQQQQQLLDQQQQQYSTTNGLLQPPPPPSINQSQESDYATTGARSGRLIREIIV